MSVNKNHQQDSTSPNTE